MEIVYHPDCIVGTVTAFSLLDDLALFSFKACHTKVEVIEYCPKERCVLTLERGVGGALNLVAYFDWDRIPVRT